MQQLQRAKTGSAVNLENQTHKNLTRLTTSGTNVVHFLLVKND
jgi:hypothetical protein